MSKKPDTHTAMRRLHQATSDLVQGIRQVHAQHGTGGSSAALRVPVLFQGTDMRVTIEAGPGVAMRNAIEHAQMQATDQPIHEPGLDARTEARDLLAMFAQDIISSEAVAGKFKDSEDERFFNRVVSAMKALDLPEGVVKV